MMHPESPQAAASAEGRSNATAAAGCSRSQLAAEERTNHLRRFQEADADQQVVIIGELTKSRLGLHYPGKHGETLYSIHALQHTRHRNGDPCSVCQAICLNGGTMALARITPRLPRADRNSFFKPSNWLETEFTPWLMAQAYNSIHEVQDRSVLYGYVFMDAVNDLRAVCDKTPGLIKSVDARDNNTLLHWAAMMDAVCVAQYLVQEASCLVTATNLDGDTSLDLAEDCKSKGVITLLKLC